MKAGVWLVVERRGKAFDGSTEVANSLQEKTSIAVPVLTFDVRLTDRFGLQAGATIPDVTRSAVVSQPTGTLNFSETFSGLGDTSVLAWYRLPRLWGWNAIVNAGSSLPTGKTETPRFRSELRDGSLVPMSRLQRGSGTVDPIIGINVNRRVYKGTIIAFGSLAARIPYMRTKMGCVRELRRKSMRAWHEKFSVTRLWRSAAPAGCIATRMSSGERRCWSVAVIGSMPRPERPFNS